MKDHQGQVYSLKSLELPNESRRHPRWAEAQYETEKYAKACGIYGAHFPATNGFFTAAHPDAEFDRLVIMGRLYAHMWFMDECWDALDIQNTESMHKRKGVLGRRLKAMLAAFERASLNENSTPDIHIFEELGWGFRQRSTDEWFNNFALALKDCVMASQKSAHFTQNLKIWPSSEEYIDFRIRDAGTAYAARLAEFGTNQPLTENIHTHRAYHDLTRAYAIAALVANELVSYHKEAVIDRRLNLVLLFMRHNGINLHEAGEKTVELHNKWTHKFIQSSHNLTQIEDTNVRYALSKYAQALGDILSGAIEWSLHSGRYHHPESPCLELQGSPPHFD